MFRRLRIWFKLDVNEGSGYEEKLDDIAGKILILAKLMPIALLSRQI